MKLLLGLGGKPDSWLALEETLARVEVTGDALTVAILEDPDATPSIDEIRARVTRTLDEAAVDPTVLTLAGEPGPALVEAAEREGVDRIVIGGGHRSPMGKVTIGPIAEFVVLNATTTVTLVR